MPSRESPSQHKQVTRSQTDSDTGGDQQSTASDRAGAIDAGIRAVMAQVAGPAIDVAGTWPALRRQTGAARAIAEAALGRAGAGDGAVTAAVAIAARTVETTTTWPIGAAAATAARGAGATFDKEVAAA